MSFSRYLATFSGKSLKKLRNSAKASFKVSYGESVFCDQFMKRFGFSPEKQIFIVKGRFQVKKVESTLPRPCGRRCRFVEPLRQKR